MEDHISSPSPLLFPFLFTPSLGDCWALTFFRRPSESAAPGGLLKSLKYPQHRGCQDASLPAGSMLLGRGPAGLLKGCVPSLCRTMGIGGVNVPLEEKSRDAQVASYTGIYDTEGVPHTKSGERQPIQVNMQVGGPLCSRSPAWKGTEGSRELTPIKESIEVKCSRAQLAHSFCPLCSSVRMLVRAQGENTNMDSLGEATRAAGARKY